MSEKLDFPYICAIPYNVMADTELEPSAKLHYACLAGLSKREGYCWATDEQLAEMHGVSLSQLKRWNKSLEEQGHIKRETENIPYRDDEGKMLWRKTRKIYVGGGFSKYVCERVKNEPIDEQLKNEPIDEQLKNEPYKEEISKHKNSKKECSSDSQSSSERKTADFVFSSSKRKFVGITDADMQSWKEAYPDIDIVREITRAEQWLLSNPSKARKKLWRKFLTGWFDRNNDKAENRKAYRTGTVTATDRRTRNIDNTPVDSPADGLF